MSRGVVAVWLTLLSAPSRAAPLDEIDRWCALNRTAVVSALAADEVAGVLRELPLVDELCPIADVDLPTQVGECDLGWLGRTLVIERHDPAPIRARLLRGVPAETAAILLRGDDGGVDNSELIVSLLIDAARILYQRDNSPAGMARLTEACYWMAAAEFEQIVRLAEGAAKGSAVVALEEKAPSEREPDPFWLAVVVPLPAGHPSAFALNPPAPIRHRVAGPGRDDFLRELMEARGTIEPEEFVRRYLAESIASERPGPAGAEWERPETVTAGAVPTNDVLFRLWPAAAEPPEVVDEADQDLLLSAYERPCRELIGAAIRSAGCVARANDAGGLLVTAPETVAERIAANQPLFSWSLGQSSSGERVFAEDQARQHWWHVCDGPLREALGGGWRRLAALPTAPRLALTRHLQLRTGWELNRWLTCLPTADGRVPLWLSYHDDEQSYRLASPGVREDLHGYAARAVEAAIRGDDLIDPGWEP